MEQYFWEYGVIRKYETPYSLLNRDMEKGTNFELAPINLFLEPKIFRTK